jgi:hypothetical protein
MPVLKGERERGRDIYKQIDQFLSLSLSFSLLYSKIQKKN